MKDWQGSGRKGRLRRKHRRDIAFHNLSLLAFRKAQRGREKIGSEENKNTAATAKKRYVPYDCKQDDFSSGPLESLNLLPIPAPWPSTNLEIIQK